MNAREYNAILDRLKSGENVEISDVAGFLREPSRLFWDRMGDDYGKQE